MEAIKKIIINIVGTKAFEQRGINPGDVVSLYIRSDSNRSHVDGERLQSAVSERDATL